MAPINLLPPQAHPQESRWQPKRYAEPPRPPYLDETMAEKEANALAAVYTLGIDSRKPKKTIERRTVEFQGGLAAWNRERGRRTSPYPRQFMRPSPDHIVELRPPAAYPNLTTSIAAKFVQTSVNKVRCPINVVKWTPEGRRVLTGCHSGEFVVWNGLTFNFETILQAHDSSIRTLAYTHSGDWIISADSSGVIKYFNPAMNNVAAWQGHGRGGGTADAAVRGLAVSPSDQHFATASDDQTIKIWAFGERREERALTGHGWDVKCVDWHPTKGLLVSGGKDNLVKFWDPRRTTELSTLHQHKNTVQTCAFSPDGLYCATGSRDQTIRVFDIRAMRDLIVLRGHQKEVCSLAWHPTHPLLASGGSSGSLLYHSLSHPTDPSSANPIWQMEYAHDSNIWSLAWHPLGHILATGSNDFTTRFWARDRPGRRAGGDKFHLGANANAIADGEGAMLVDEVGDEDEDAPIPGLGTAAPPFSRPSSAFPDRGPSFAPSFDGLPLPGLGGAPPGLPGLGGSGPPPGLPGLGGPPPGLGGAGAGDMAGAADRVSGRAARPLPSQEDMVRSVGAAPTGWGTKRGKRG